MTNVTTRPVTRVTAFAAFAALLAAACGGAAPAKSAAPPQAPAQAPAVGGQPGYPREAAESTSTAPATPQAGAAQPQPAPPPATDGQRSDTRSNALAARREVEAAQRELEVAGADCRSACRALGSMERATARVCVLEEASCEDVRGRLVRARQRVRTTCGECPGGPSVDPDAPIPSR
ncbi:MAG: hypothetical protein U0235_32100 [Polyangiaceae bacterium]